jgi:DNA repair protein RecN (Recombination protein N)
MLALKNVFAEKDAVPSLVFDEIDTGVSGVAAQRVGEKLATLSRTKQVLCVTHLPQIAAMADEQYLVEKREKNSRTYTDIRILDSEGRCRELARLQSGEVITEAVLSAAAELLNKAEIYRNNLR